MPPAKYPGYAVSYTYPTCILRVEYDTLGYTGIHQDTSKIHPRYIRVPCIPLKSLAHTPGYTHPSGYAQDTRARYM